MQNNPLVTIICLCFNHEKYVQECIESIINQSYSTLEFIIVDNNSRDNSIKKIEEYNAVCSKRFINYKFIKNATNLGITKALNKAVKIAKGEYISYISADDMYVPDKLEIQINAFKDLDEKYALVCGDCDIIDKNNKKVFLNENGKVYYDNKKGFATGTAYILRNRDSDSIMSNYGEYQTLFKSNYVQAASVLIRKRVLDEIGLFDENFFYEDWPLWLLISRNYRFYYIDKIFFHYRKHPSIMTNSFREKFKVENTRIILREKEYCLKNNYKTLWLEKYTGRIYSLILNKDYLNSVKYFIKSKSFSLLCSILLKAIKKLKI